MKISDWVYTGVKLLAVYFGAVGAIAAGVVAMGLLSQSFFAVVASAYNTPPETALRAYYNLFDFVQPALYLLASWFLARNTGIIFKLLRVRTPHEDADTTPAAVEVPPAEE